MSAKNPQEYATDQETFWAGKFGEDYIARNNEAKMIGVSAAFFAKALNSAHSIQSVLEFGCNVGVNINALSKVLPAADLSGIEINQKAVQEFQALNPKAKIYHQTIFEFKCDYQRDLTLIKGVLIHINPDFLPSVYDLLYQSSKRYILVAEYYNPTPVAVSYRGHSDRLFKRDFAGEMLDRFPDLELVNYGFGYHRDNNFPQDDLTWFLLQKR